MHGPTTFKLLQTGMILSKLTSNLVRINRFDHRQRLPSVLSREMASYLKPNLRKMSYEEKEKFVREAIDSHSSGVLVFSKTY